MIKSIAIVGDFFRPDGNGNPGGVDRSTIWLFNALKRPLSQVCRLPVEAITAAGTPGLAGRLSAARAPGDSALYWAARYQTIEDNEPLLPLLVDLLQDRFCIGTEMPPYLIHLLERMGIPWIDIRVHPIRFLDDLLFAVRGSTAEAQAMLIAKSMQEEEVAITAGLVEAMCRYVSDSAMSSGTLLVLGQRPMDSSQIMDGRFFDAYAHADMIGSICAGYRALVLKPHPMPDHVHALLAVAAAQPNTIAVVSDNTYRMLALPEIAGVLTVNSSVAYEAPYFGKIVHTLAPLPIRIAWRGAVPDADAYASIRDNVLLADFWRGILAPYVRVSPLDGTRLPLKPNRLRIARDAFWDYQQIDTDRVPNRPMTVNSMKQQLPRDLFSTRH